MPKPTPTIKKTADFQNIFEKGKKFFAQSLGIYFYPSERLKIGIVISKKQGIAIKQNRTRRLIKEFFAQHAGKISPAEIIIIARAPLIDNYYDTERIMLKLLHKAGLTK